jgi:hypothetical protein
MDPMVRRRTRREYSKIELHLINEELQVLQRQHQPREKIVPRKIDRIEVRGDIHASLRRPNHALSA